VHTAHRHLMRHSFCQLQIFEELKQFVGWLEPAARHIDWRHLSQGRLLERKVSIQISLRGFGRFMTQPKSDHRRLPRRSVATPWPPYVAYVVLYIVGTMYPPGLCRVISVCA